MGTILVEIFAKTLMVAPNKEIPFRIFTYQSTSPKMKSICYKCNISKNSCDDRSLLEEDGIDRDEDHFIDN